MSDSKATAAAIVIALLLAGSLLVQVGQLRATNGALGRIRVIEEKTPDIPPRWEYQVVSIGDAEWDSKAGALGEVGWEIVSARRASDGDSNFAYECIVKRMKD